MSFKVLICDEILDFSFINVFMVSVELTSTYALFSIMSLSLIILLNFKSLISVILLNLLNLLVWLNFNIFEQTQVDFDLIYYLNENLYCGRFDYHFI